MNTIGLLKRLARGMAYSSLASMVLWIGVTLVGLNRAKGPTPLEGLVIQCGGAFTLVFALLAVIFMVMVYVTEKRRGM